MTRLRCLDCQDGRHCRHRGYVPAGMILAPCRCLDCDPRPIQARLFSHAVVENDLGGCVDCGQPATSLCEACEYCRYLAATGGRDLANEERARWASRPFHGLKCASALARRVPLRGGRNARPVSPGPSGPTRGQAGAPAGRQPPSGRPSWPAPAAEEERA
jgi:hypothetical protein